MTVNSAAKAVLTASKQTRNVVGTCQKAVRTWFDAPSAGDQDGDGDSDARDGWLSEPRKYKVFGDRNPPNGAPLYFSKDNGKGFGHRAMAVPRGVRSTDMSGNRYKAGVTSTVVAKTKSEAIAIIEAAMGVVYVGYSKSIDGNPIPGLADVVPPKPKPPVKNKTRGAKVDKAIVDAKSLVKDIKGAARDAKETVRNKQLTLAAKQAGMALANLEKVPFLK